MSASTVNLRAQLQSMIAAEKEAIPAPSPQLSPSLLKVVVVVSSVLLFVSVCLVLAAKYFGDGFASSGHTINPRRIEYKIGIDRLKVPANTIRFESQRIPGEIRKLDLYLHWPSLSGFTEPLREEFNARVETANIVFLTLEKRTMSFDMSGRILPIYKRFFDGPGIQEAYGLVQQPLNSSAGFMDEDLYYAAASPYPYAARCVRETSKIATPFCIRDIHVGRDLMLTYRFHKRFLPQWIDLDQAMRQYVKSLVTNL